MSDGRSPPPPPPPTLFLNQTEAQRAEKNYFWRPPLIMSGSWWPGLPLIWRPGSATDMVSILNLRTIFFVCMFLSQIWSYIWDIKLNYSTFNVLTLFFFASLTGLYLFPWIFHQDLDTTHSPWKDSKNKKNHHDYWSKIILVKNFQPRDWLSISPSHNHSWIRAMRQTKLRITHC